MWTRQDKLNGRTCSAEISSWLAIFWDDAVEKFLTCIKYPCFCVNCWANLSCFWRDVEELYELFELLIFYILRKLCFWIEWVQLFYSDVIWVTSRRTKWVWGWIRALNDYRKFHISLDECEKLFSKHDELVLFHWNSKAQSALCLRVENFSVFLPRNKLEDQHCEISSSFHLT